MRKNGFEAGLAALLPVRALLAAELALGEALLADGANQVAQLKQRLAEADALIARGEKGLAKDSGEDKTVNKTDETVTTERHNPEKTVNDDPPLTRELCFFDEYGNSMGIKLAADMIHNLMISGKLYECGDPAFDHDLHLNHDTAFTSDEVIDLLRAVVIKMTVA